MRRAFTLVELLVVIGIIAVLLAILLPTLGRAREAANRVKCLATLRSMSQAAHLHASDHRGYMPIAGVQAPREKGVFPTPEGLLDAQRLKYMYYPDDGAWRPLPLPAALGHYMGLSALLLGVDSERSKMSAVLALDSVRRHFVCPSQPPESVRLASTVSDGVSSFGPNVYMGYLFNGSALGRVIAAWGETPAGNVGRIRRPADVFLFTDGNGIGPDQWMGHGIHASYSADETLFDRARGSRYMDYERHRGRFNVVFVDGHAETLRLPDPRYDPDDPGNEGDLKRVGISKGIFK